MDVGGGVYARRFVSVYVYNMFVRTYMNVCGKGVGKTCFVSLITWFSVPRLLS